MLKSFVFLIAALSSFLVHAEQFCYKVTVRTKVSDLIKAGIAQSADVDGAADSSANDGEEWSLQVFDQDDQRVVKRSSDKLNPPFNVSEIFCRDRDNYLNLTIKVVDNDYFWLLPWTWGKWDNDTSEIATIAIEPNQSVVSDMLVMNDVHRINVLTDYNKEFNEGTIIEKEFDPKTNSLVNSKKKIVTQKEYKEYTEKVSVDTYMAYYIKIERVSGVSLIKK